MTKIERFEDIEVWKRSKTFTNQVYKVFKSLRDYSFRDQIQRASVSIMNNIAEGYERKGNKEFKKYLYIAKGSVAEVRSMLSLAKDLNYIGEPDYTNIYEESLIIAKQLSKFISAISDN